MSRSKKSRKPGGAPTAKPKLSKQELATVEKRSRKTTGKPAGNRQQEANPLVEGNNQQGGKKDPRLGNKTPIALGKFVAKVEKVQKTKVDKRAPMAAIRIEDPDEKVPTLSPMEELEAIEQDEKLQDILGKQEEDIALTEEEVDYYNKLMDRHEELSTELGLDSDDDDDSDDEESENVSANEDDLWDKLDRPLGSDDFS